MDLLAFNIKDAFNAEEFQTALSWLPDQEHSLVTRFKFERDQHLALASLLLRRHYFSERLQVPWSALEFDKLPLGKPILKNQDIEYNTSHEGNWVIFGATKQKGIQIGVDAVVIDCPKSMSIDDFIQSFHPQLTEHEMQLIKNAENHDMQLRTFFELWACKESYIKAIGVGLSLKLNKLDFRNENNQIKLKLDGQDLTSWRFHLSSLDDNTLTVVCYGHQSDQKLDTNIIDFPFNTKLLGNKPLHGNAIFGQLKYQDLKNNKWIESRK
ncbi:4'-phosphopantetheinyl transferase superfamily [Pilaira anomala]|nr:4'-phosphopantetheinyl transferase superfamily [Pilaira anomala]